MGRGLRGGPALVSRPGAAAILLLGLVLVLIPPGLRLYGRLSGRRDLANLGEVET